MNKNKEKQKKDRLQIRNYGERFTARAEDDDDVKKIGGTGLTYGKVTEIWRNEWELIEAGAFTESLKENTFCLAHHKWDQVLGRTDNKTMDITDTTSTLDLEVELPDTTFANDLYANVERADIDGMSVGFYIKEYTIVRDYKHENGDVGWLFKVTKADLAEVSIVARPAYVDTSAETRSRPIYHELEQEKERSFLSMQKKLILHDRIYAPEVEARIEMARKRVL